MRPAACVASEAIPLAIDVRRYTTDGSGTGTVEVATTTRAGDGTVATETRDLAVARTGTEWRVLSTD